VDLRDYVRILRSRWRLILLCTLLAVAAAAAATATATRQYQAQSQLFVSTADVATASTLSQGGQFAQQRVKSYADIVNSPLVTGPVVQQLGLDTTAADLAKQVTATAPLDTVLINVSVRDRSPQRAQQIADAVADRFTQVAATLETSASSQASPVKVSVVRRAELPLAPVSPRPTLNLALGLLVGLAVGVGAAVLRETLDTSLKGIDEVQQELGLPTLGTIAFDPETAKHPLIVHASPRSTRAEAFRQLRTNLQFIDIDKPPRSILVTSSVPQEGKSTSVCNLAIALTEAGARVALVEGDLRRPRIAEYLGVEGAAGLTDVLVGRADLDDVLQPWGNGALLVLPSGPIPPNPSELLGSQHMDALVRQLENEVDLVLIDAPPLLPVTDAAVMSTLVTGAIIVVRAGKTTRDQARRALDSLHGVGAHVYGVVLNMVPTKGPDAYRYGYYGYGYAAQERARNGGHRKADEPAAAGR
jgi:capsular exopolysaccharide synthesis family protein